MFDIEQFDSKEYQQKIKESVEFCANDLNLCELPFIKPSEYETYYSDPKNSIYFPKTLKSLQEEWDTRRNPDALISKLIAHEMRHFWQYSTGVMQSYELNPNKETMYEYVTDRVYQEIGQKICGEDLYIEFTLTRWYEKYYLCLNVERGPSSVLFSVRKIPEKYVDGIAGNLNYDYDKDSTKELLKIPQCYESFFLFEFESIGKYDNLDWEYDADKYSYELLEKMYL